MKQKYRIKGSRRLLFAFIAAIGALLPMTAKAADPTFSLSMDPASPEFVVGRQTSLDIILGNSEGKGIIGITLNLNVGADYKLVGIEKGSSLADTKFTVSPADLSLLPENGVIPVTIATTDMSELMTPIAVSGNILRFTFECVGNDPGQSGISFIDSSVKITGGFPPSDYLQQAGVTLETEGISGQQIITPVTSLTILNTPSGDEINVGASWTFNLQAMPADASLTSVEWSAAPEGIVSWSNGNGNSLEVTGVKAGEVTLTVNATTVYNGGSETATATYGFAVKNIEAASVTVDPSSLVLTEGETGQLTATVMPENTTDKRVAWTSSDPSVASVSETGMVTALKAGTADITATCGAQSGSCRVTVNAKEVSVESITVAPSSLELTEGETGTLTATVMPENATDKTVTWTSSDPSTVSVNASGVVTALKAGKATITAVAGGKSANCVVTVKAKVVAVESISVAPASLELTVGGSGKLTASVMPANATDKTVTWTSSNTAVATVDENGTVTAVKAGTATITATSSNGLKARSAVTVKNKTIEVKKVTVIPSAAQVEVGKSIALRAVIEPDNAGNQNITWRSENEDIAIVTTSGTVKGVSPGEAVIWAIASNGVRGQAVITVVERVVEAASIRLNVESMTLTVGSSDRLTAMVMPENASDKTVTWSSADPKTATVDNNGLVKAIAAGETTVTAMCGAVSATCAVKVVADPNEGDDDPNNPGGDNPGGDNPGGDNPGGDNPGGDNPGGDNPGGDNPGGDNPGGDNPGGDNPGGDNPGGDNPGGDNPGGDNPGGDNPGGDNPGGDNPGGDNPGGDNPGGDNPGGDNPGGDNPGGDNPGGDNPGGDNPGGDNPGGDNPGGDNPGGDNPGGDNPGGDNPGGDNPGGDNPGGDNPGGDNPGGDNPGGDNPGGDNPGGDNPGGDNPGGDNPGGDNPGGDNPGGDNPGGNYSPASVETSELLWEVKSGTTVDLWVMTEGGNPEGWTIEWSSPDDGPLAADEYSLSITAENDSPGPAAYEYLARVANTAGEETLFEGEYLFTVIVWGEPKLPGDDDGDDDNGGSGSGDVSYDPEHGYTTGNGVYVSEIKTREGNGLTLYSEEPEGGYNNEWSYLWTLGEEEVGQGQQVYATAGITGGSPEGLRKLQTSSLYKVGLANYGPGGDLWYEATLGAPEVEVYSRPQTPQQLLRKGNGTSCTFIAMSALANDELAALGYGFVFGYTDAKGEAHVISDGAQRYCHTDREVYNDGSNRFWVYTTWSFSDGSLVSSGLRYLDGSVDEGFDASDFTGTVKAEALTQGQTRIYTLDGHYVGDDSSRLAPGIYVKHTAGGSLSKAEKIVVR